MSVHCRCVLVDMSVRTYSLEVRIVREVDGLWTLLCACRLESMALGGDHDKREQRKVCHMDI